MSSRIFLKWITLERQGYNNLSKYSVGIIVVLIFKCLYFRH